MLKKLLFILLGFSYCYASEIESGLSMSLATRVDCSINGYVIGYLNSNSELNNYELNQGTKFIGKITPNKDGSCNSNWLRVIDTKERTIDIESNPNIKLNPTKFESNVNYNYAYKFKITSSK